MRWLPSCGLLVLCVACERPPVDPPPPPPPEGRIGPLALDKCIQDRPAIAGKWYDYNPDGHTLDPKAQAWIVRDGDRYAAFRIVSIYEQDAVESGRFTLAVATHDGDAWGAETEWLTPRNVKLTGPLCVDVFARSEVSCDGEQWQLKLAVFSYLSPLSAFTVANFGVFARSVAGRTDLGDVHVARVDDTTTLGALPAPTTIANLADAPASSWDNTDWAFDRFAPDLPEAGMALGNRFAAGDVYWLFASRYDIVRFRVERAGDTLRFELGSLDVEFDTLTTEDVEPETRTLDVPLPPANEARYFTFTTPDGSLSSADLAGTRYPFLPPDAKRWDLAIERIDDDVRLLVSPAACVINATRLGLDEERPPASTP
jgi:hypothetical protein